MGNLMNYEEYVHCQTVIHGQIEKPEHYHIAERKAIDYLFKDVPKMSLILDVGCGSGLGMKHLRSLGYLNTFGLELHPEKARIANAFEGDIASFVSAISYDVIYSSHSFEHTFDPTLALERMKEIASEFIFILPYPDTGDSNAHRASFEIGTRIDDEGKTVVSWFEDRGLKLIQKTFDNFREAEIWLKFQRV